MLQILRSHVSVFVREYISKHTLLKSTNEISSRHQLADDTKNDQWCAFASVSTTITIIIWTLINWIVRPPTRYSSVLLALLSIKTMTCHKAASSFINLKQNQAIKRPRKTDNRRNSSLKYSVRLVREAASLPNWSLSKMVSAALIKLSSPVARSCLIAIGVALVVSYRLVSLFQHGNKTKN